MTDTTVVIKAKNGCSDLGVTPELANRLATGKKTTLLAIVEYEAEMVHKATDGSKRTVDLKTIALEPIVEPDNLEGRTEDVVRRIQAALYQNRVRAAADAAGQLPLDGDKPTGPGLDDLAKQADALVETNDLDEPTGLYDPDADGKSDVEPGPENDFAADSKPEDKAEPLEKEPAFSS